MLTGCETGPALVRSQSGESLLLKALKYDGLEMPPTGKLPDEVIADFAKWIDMGAPDPRGCHSFWLSVRIVEFSSRTSLTHGNLHG